MGVPQMTSGTIPYDVAPEPKECSECERLDNLLLESMYQLPEEDLARTEIVLDEIRSHLMTSPSHCGKLM